MKWYVLTFGYFLLIELFMLVAPGFACCGIRWMREGAANQFYQIKKVRLSDGMLSLESRLATKARIVLHATAPLDIANSSNAKATLRPVWDGTLGYSLFILEWDVPAAGNVVVKINSVLSPQQSLSSTPAELYAWVQKLISQTSRFPNDPARFLCWQMAYRAKLTEWLMREGWPERISLKSQVLATRDYTQFSLQRVQYCSQRDRTNIFLLSIPKEVQRIPPMLAFDQRVRAGVVGCSLSTWNHYGRYRMPSHCGCGIVTQLGGRLKQCDWAAKAAPKPVLFQRGRQDSVLCPGADPKIPEFTSNTEVMPLIKYDVAVFRSEPRMRFQESQKMWPTGFMTRDTESIMNGSLNG